LTDAARGLTFGVLPRLDGNRKARVFKFLRSAGLLTVDTGGPYKFWLRGADFSGADMSKADLDGDCLVLLNFRGADVSGANLDGATLWHVDLSGAHLSDAILQGVELIGTELPGIVGVLEEQGKFLGDPVTAGSWRQLWRHCMTAS
jgi:hypothetical protein